MSNSREKHLSTVQTIKLGSNQNGKCPDQRKIIVGGVLYLPMGLIYVYHWNRWKNMAS